MMARFGPYMLYFERAESGEYARLQHDDRMMRVRLDDLSVIESTGIDDATVARMVANVELYKRSFMDE